MSIKTDKKGREVAKRRWRQDVSGLTDDTRHLLVVNPTLDQASTIPEVAGRPADLKRGERVQSTHINAEGAEKALRDWLHATDWLRAGDAKRP